jgi:hypothetical protein
MRLKRGTSLPWAFLLRRLRAGDDAVPQARIAARRFFTDEPVALGIERTAEVDPNHLPCGQRTDTGRARLVRREKNPFKGCATCALRAACLAMSPQPTLLWQLQRVGVLDRELRLTPRGEIVGAFLGPEGLAIAAALEDPKYPLESLLFDIANITAGERFSGTNPRGLGRLAAACERSYHRATIDGHLVHGLPPQYGYGACDVVRARVEGERVRAIAEAQETAGRGDIDRLMTEWRSLLRQIAMARPLTRRAAGDVRRGDEIGRVERHLADRWEELQGLARAQLADQRQGALPELPPLTAEQRRPINHRLLRLRVGTAGR